MWKVEECLMLNLHLMHSSRLPSTFRCLLEKEGSWPAACPQMKNFVKIGGGKGRVHEPGEVEHR